MEYRRITKSGSIPTDARIMQVCEEENTFNKALARLDCSSWYLCKRLNDLEERGLIHRKQHMPLITRVKEAHDGPAV